MHNEFGRTLDNLEIPQLSSVGAWEETILLCWLDGMVGKHSLSNVSNSLANWRTGQSRALHLCFAKGGRAAAGVAGEHDDEELRSSGSAGGGNPCIARPASRMPKYVPSYSYNTIAAGKSMEFLRFLFH